MRVGAQGRLLRCGGFQHDLLSVDQWDDQPEAQTSAKSRQIYAILPALRKCQIPMRNTILSWYASL